ncbi:MAG: ABC transporter ATP-binding protein [Treponema sp.]|nr:ABC transporter ATP-binding protein [Treponema sp.]
MRETGNADTPAAPTGREWIRTEGLGFSQDTTEILRNITLEIGEGELVGLIGPNGCGKTTLLKNLYRVYKPSRGAAYLDGKSLRAFTPRALAQKMAVLAQEQPPPFDFTVMEMVLMGRYARLKPLESPGDRDARICEGALDQVGLLRFRDRNFRSLSGGEKQRVLLAAAFAQETAVIILDEPTNHLDVGHQLQVMDIISRHPDATVFASIHDLNIAAAYCDRLIAMNHGEIIASGPPDTLLTAELIRTLFQVQVRLSREEETGRLHISFIRAVP